MADRTRPYATLAGLALLLLGAGCGAGDYDEQECDVTIRFDEHVYRPASVVRVPLMDRELGTGDEAGCGGAEVEGLGKVRVFAVQGIDPTAAIMTSDSDVGTAPALLYVDIALKPADWPEGVREAMKYVTCTGPASFVGRWWVVDAEDMPVADDFDLDVPYTGTFTAESGSGLPFDRWKTVDVRATVTARTRPVPDADFVAGALTEAEPVRVRTRCEQGSFEVETIAAAR